MSSPPSLPDARTLFLSGPTADISGLAQFCGARGKGPKSGKGADADDARLTARRPWRRIEATSYDTAAGGLGRGRRALDVFQHGNETSLRLFVWARDDWRVVERRLPAPAGFATAGPLADGALSAAAILDRLDRADREEALGALSLSPGDALAPIAALRADEAVAVSILGEAIIEATLVVGRVDVEDGIGGYEGDASPVGLARICLLKGPADELFSYARAAIRASAGRIAPAAGEKAHWRGASRASDLTKPRKVRIDPNGDAAAALAEGLSASAARLAELRGPLSLARDPEAARQARVALRRLRTFERVYRGAVGGRGLRRIAKRAGRLARVIGGARDWDVFLGATLSELEASGFDPKGAARLNAAAGKARDAAWRAVHAEVSSPDYPLLVLDTLEAASAQQWRKGAADDLSADVRAFADAALDVAFGEAHAIADEIPPGDEAGLHDLRLALKRFRYAAQAFRDIYPRESRKPYFQAMSALQERLGALNDAVVAQGLALEAAKGGGRPAARAAGYVCGRAAERAARAADAAWDEWRALAGTPRYWRAAPVSDDSANANEAPEVISTAPFKAGAAPREC